MTLWETNAEVYRDLRESYAESTGVAVQVRQADGERGIRKVTAATLVLVDPPNLKPSAMLGVLGALGRRRVPFLCWTPLRSRYDATTGAGAESLGASRSGGGCPRSPAGCRGGLRFPTCAVVSPPLKTERLTKPPKFQLSWSG